jgi:3-dehydroquinate synthase
VARIVSLLERAGLPVKPPAGISSEQFVQLMSVDKKNVDGEIRLILLKAIGQATLPIGVDEKLLYETLSSYKN